MGQIVKYSIPLKALITAIKINWIKRRLSRPFFYRLCFHLNKTGQQKVLLLILLFVDGFFNVCSRVKVRSYLQLPKSADEIQNYYGFYLCIGMCVTRHVYANMRWKTISSVDLIAISQGLFSFIATWENPSRMFRRRCDLSCEWDFLRCSRLAKSNLAYTFPVWVIRKNKLEQQSFFFFSQKKAVSSINLMLMFSYLWSWIQNTDTIKTIPNRLHPCLYVYTGNSIGVKNINAQIFMVCYWTISNNISHRIIGMGNVACWTSTKSLRAHPRSLAAYASFILKGDCKRMPLNRIPYYFARHTAGIHLRLSIFFIWNWYLPGSQCRSGVWAIGRIEATEIGCGSQNGGRIEDILVSERWLVTAGQIVARMDTEKTWWRNYVRRRRLYSPGEVRCGGIANSQLVQREAERNKRLWHWLPNVKPN